MKKLLFSCTLLAILFSSCVKDKCSETRTYTIWEPIYLTAEDIRQEVSLAASRALENPGKLYFYNNFILINEVHEGIHIIDNTNPESPVNIGFIAIPGNVDMSVKDNVLYADNYIDLLSIDISDIQSPNLVNIDEEVFDFYNFNPDQGFVVEYVETNQTVELDCDAYGYYQPWFFEGDVIFASTQSDLSSVGATSNGGSAPGVGGSMARFTISGDHLYCLNQQNMRVFDIQNLSNPILQSTVEIGWGLETIFPYEDNLLFLGANNAMYIYDISTPTNPIQTATFAHAQACDPVYVENNIAYITLRDGTPCQNFTNQLDIVNVEDIYAPELIASHQMNHPHGLSVNEGTLYLCEGTHGLKVYDVSDPNNISIRGDVSSIDAFDAIYLGNDHLLVIGKDGLYQFNTAESNDLKEISRIPVLTP